MGRSRPKPVPRRHFVLDCSIAAAWYFADEADAYADAVAKSLAKATAVVPSHFHLELANFLLVGERRKRSTIQQATSFVALLARFPIIIDGQAAAQAWSETIALARAAGLSAYHAAYLELAGRKSLALATLDKPLRDAADSLGIPRYRP